MFTGLSEQLSGVLRRLAGRGVLGEDEVVAALRETRRHLLGADDHLAGLLPGATPAIVDGSRRRRVAQGAGRPVQEVNRLPEQFQQMRKLMKRM